MNDRQEMKTDEISVCGATYRGRYIVATWCPLDYGETPSQERCPETCCFRTPKQPYYLGGLEWADAEEDGKL